jgi:hypothetical protein
VTLGIRSIGDGGFAARVIYVRRFLLCGTGNRNQQRTEIHFHNLVDIVRRIPASNVMVKSKRSVVVFLKWG